MRLSSPRHSPRRSVSFVFVRFDRVIALSNSCLLLVVLRPIGQPLLAIYYGTNLWPFMSYQRTLMVVFLRLVGVHSVELQQPREYVEDAQYLYERLIVVVFVAIVFV